MFTCFELLTWCLSLSIFKNESFYVSLGLKRIAGLMMMASHQTFSGQLWHLTDQTKFDQTNLLYIINGEVYKFTIGKQMSGQPYHKH